MKNESTYIRHEGMGNFLNPTNDAEHKYSVRYRDGMSSLRGALKDSWIPESTKTRINQLIAENPPVFTAEWEHECYAYFRGCYSADGTNRNVSKLVKEGPPEFHLAYLHIREFFPDAKPNLELIANPPQWGKAKGGA